MSEIVIAIADPEQRIACYRLAYEVFCEELGIMRREADHAARIICDPDIEAAQVLCATVDGKFAGTVAILFGTSSRFPPYFEETFDIERYAAVVPRSRMVINFRFLVKPEFRNSPLPFRMLVEVSRIQSQHGIQVAFCECQPHLLSLYESLGFRPCARVIDETAWGITVPLLFSVADIAHLRSVRSPLLRSMPGMPEDPILAAKVAALLPDFLARSTTLDPSSWSETFGLLSQPGRRSGVFADFTEEEITTFLHRSHVLECGDGQQIIVKGHNTRSAFVVLEGIAEVRLDGKMVARFEKGDLFGEFALVLHTRRTADVFASGDQVRVVVLDERTLERLLTHDAPLASKFLMNLAKSLALRLLSRS